MSNENELVVENIETVKRHQMEEPDAFEEAPIEEGPMDGFDLDAMEEIAAEDKPFPVELRWPDGTPMLFRGKPVTVTMHSVLSQRYRQAEKIERRKKIKGRLTRDDLHEAELEKLAYCCDGWYGFHHKGTPIPFSRDAFKKILMRASFLYPQIVEGMNDTARFTQSGSKQQSDTSASTLG